MTSRAVVYLMMPPIYSKEAKSTSLRFLSTIYRCLGRAAQAHDESRRALCSLWSSLVAHTVRPWGPCFSGYAPFNGSLFRWQKGAQLTAVHLLVPRSSTELSRRALTRGLPAARNLVRCPANMGHYPCSLYLDSVAQSVPATAAQQALCVCEPGVIPSRVAHDLGLVVQPEAGSPWPRGVAMCAVSVEEEEVPIHPFSHLWTLNFAPCRRLGAVTSPIGDIV
ncbi:hypothetical protein C8Q72DRAFT_798230 [Fomitopsis betulina]|nr:hypothetical protein C8Q72DRAFT_798230 [Fomitopsis betulina]